MVGGRWSKNWQICYTMEHKLADRFDIRLQLRNRPSKLEFLLAIIRVDFFCEVLRNNTLMSILKVHDDLTGASSSKGVETPKNVNSFSFLANTSRYINSRGENIVTKNVSHKSCCRFFFD